MDKHSSNSHSFFVITATVAAELNSAMLVAQQISLIASNARALAQRAGHKAAGFKALTGFIDELANKTVKASHEINGLAIETSKTAVITTNNQFASLSLLKAVKLAEKADYVASILPMCDALKLRATELKHKNQRQVWRLTSALEELSRELRTATVLAAMSRVEASQAGKEFQQQLEVIADNVARAAEKIQSHVRLSQSLFHQHSQYSL